MQASLSLALSLCLGCAATVPWSASLERLPDVRTRALLAGASAVASAAKAGTARFGSVASQALLDTYVVDPTATVSEEEVQAWQDLLEVAAPGTALPVVTAQAWPGWPVPGAGGRIAAALRTDAPLR
jgi:hypothetical protein